MNRYQKEMAQYNKRIPVYKYPVMFRLMESDLVKIKSTEKGLLTSIKNLVSSMGNVSSGQREYEEQEGKLTDYYFYYDDPAESEQERKAIALKEFQTGTTSVHNPLLKNLRKDIDYELFIGEGEYVYQPRYKF